MRESQAIQVTIIIGLTALDLRGPGQALAHISGYDVPPVPDEAGHQVPADAWFPAASGRRGVR